MHSAKQTCIPLWIVMFYCRWNLRNLKCSSYLNNKGTVHSKRKILPLFAHLHVFPNMHAAIFLWKAQKGKYLKGYGMIWNIMTLSIFGKRGKREHFGSFYLGARYYEKPLVNHYNSQSFPPYHWMNSGYPLTLILHTTWVNSIAMSLNPSLTGNVAICVPARLWQVIFSPSSLMSQLQLTLLVILSSTEAAISKDTI